MFDISCESSTLSAKGLQIYKNAAFMKSYNAKASQMPKLPGPVAQLVIASPTADPGVESSIPARSHTYSLPLIQEKGCYKQSMCTKNWLTA